MKSIHIKYYGNNLLIIVASLVYALSFLFICIKYISPLFSGAHFYFIWNGNSILWYMFVAFLFSALICIQYNPIKRFFYEILYIMVIIPFCCIYFFCNGFIQYTIFFLYCIFAFMIIAIVLLIPLTSHIPAYCRYIKVDYIMKVLTILTLITICRYIVINGLDIFNLNLLRVYETRLILRESMTGLWVYVDEWSMKVFNPLCLLISLHRHRKKDIILYVLLQIILFGFSSHKLVLFTVFLIIGFYYMSPIILKQSHYTIWIAILCLFSPIYTNILYLFDLWRRALLVPSQLSYYYYAYFSQHDFDWFARSFLRHFIKSQYDIPLPRIIGREFFHNVYTHANTGFLGSGYAQGGVVIIIIYSILIGYTINVVAKYGKVLSPKIVIGTMLLPILIPMVSSDLPMSYVTGGIGIALILISILARCKDRDTLI